MSRLLVANVLIVIILGTFCTRHKTSEQAEFTGGTITDPPYNIELIKIPAGILSVTSGPGGHETEYLLKSIYIGKYEITQAQWKQVMGSDPSEFKGDSLPVETVSWYDAREFCEKLSKETGHTYRLPTGPEWEYACRAGAETIYHFGNDTLLIGEYDWYRGNAGTSTHPVGRKKPNKWGLYDLHGNVAEWSATLWDPTGYNGAHPDNPVTDLRYTLRGGYFRHSRLAAYGCSYEHAMPPQNKSKYGGFRVVCEMK